MQTLGISNSTPQTENRLKSLFWPSIQTSTDVDYLGTQGFWVCAFVGTIEFIVSVVQGHPIGGFFALLFYFLGGVGVRERSRYAAAIVLALYLAEFALGVSIMRVVLFGILLSNLRATWIASSWKAESAEATIPPRFGETLADKFADRLPPWLWPKVRIVYYVFSAVLLILVCYGIVLLLQKR
jgi:hypothetical protein